MLWQARRDGVQQLPHKHDELELNLVVAGQARYLVKERRYDLARRSMIWLFPQQPHILLERSANFQMWIAVFKPKMLRTACSDESSEPLLQADPQGDFACQISPESFHKLETLFGDIATEQSRDQPLYNSGLAYLLLQAWRTFLATDRSAAWVEVHPAVERAAHILQSAVDPISLDDLADEVGLSPSHLSRLFKQQTGASLVGYRQRVALQRFLRIYGDGRRFNMLEAAGDAGFGSYPQFHKVFRKVMGMSPSQYRRQQKAE